MQASEWIRRRILDHGINKENFVDICAELWFMPHKPEDVDFLRHHFETYFENPNVHDFGIGYSSLGGTFPSFETDTIVFALFKNSEIKAPEGIIFPQTPSLHWWAVDLFSDEEILHYLNQRRVNHEN